MVTKPTIYTKEFVLAELQSMLQEVKGNDQLFFIGQLFESRDYSRQRFSEWANAFESNEEISDIIKKIEEMLETRLVKGGFRSRGRLWG